jgi:periplasmic protein TonB
MPSWASTTLLNKFGGREEQQRLMLVKCVVTVGGAVKDCRVVRGLPFMDRAVVEALERRRYRPALLYGKPVEVEYTFKIRLALPR